jgi:mRNA interferase RelE/StbE
MAKYKLELKDKVRKKDFDGIPKKFLVKVVEIIGKLRDNPLPRGVEKLGGNKYRVRQGDYRILYEVADHVVTVTKVGTRQGVYKK